MLEEAKATDQAEDERYGLGLRGETLPEELRSRRTRPERLKACKERLEQGAALRAAEQQAHLEKRKAREAETGKKLRGRKPKAPEASVDAKAKANVTDPEIRILKTRQGYLQGYNAQLVGSQDQIIVAAEVSQDANDKPRRTCGRQVGRIPSEPLWPMQGTGMRTTFGKCLRAAWSSSWRRPTIATSDKPSTQLLLPTPRPPARSPSTQGGDAPKALDPGGTGGLRLTRADRRAGVRADQRGARL
jgi:hypothetical protein